MWCNVINSCDGLSCLYNLYEKQLSETLRDIQITKVVIATKRRVWWILRLRTRLPLCDNSLCHQKYIDVFMPWKSKNRSLDKVLHFWMVPVRCSSPSGCKLWRVETETKPIWKTCLIYTHVNKNSNSLLQSIKQAAMKNKQNVIGEWQFITIYGPNCTHS